MARADLLFATFAILLNFLGGSPLIAPLAAACAYGARYRRYVIPAATLLMLYQNGFWVDTALVARVAEREGLTGQIDQPLLFAGMLALGQIDQPLLFAGMLALVFLLCSGLILFWHRFAAVAFCRRSTLCLIAVFLGVLLIAQDRRSRRVAARVALVIPDDLPAVFLVPRLCTGGCVSAPASAALAAPRRISPVLGIDADAVRQGAFVLAKVRGQDWPKNSR